MEEKKTKNMVEALTAHAETLRLANGDEFELKEDAIGGLPGVDTTGHGARVMMAIVEASRRHQIDGATSKAMVAIMNEVTRTTCAVSIAAFEELERCVQRMPNEVLLQLPSIEAFVFASIVGTIEAKWKASGRVANHPHSRAMMAVFSEAGESFGRQIVEGISEDLIRAKAGKVAQELLAKTKSDDAPTLSDDDVRRILRRPRGSA